jgi:hypothetical protein
MAKQNKAQPGYQLYMVWRVRRRGIAPTLIGLLFYLTWLSSKPVESKHWLGVCMGQFEKTVYARGQRNGRDWFGKTDIIIRQIVNKWGS